MLVYLYPLQLLMFIIDKIGNIIIMDSMFLFGVMRVHLSILLFLSWGRKGGPSGGGFYSVLEEGIKLICPFLGYRGWIRWIAMLIYCVLHIFFGRLTCSTIDTFPPYLPYLDDESLLELLPYPKKKLWKFYL